MKNQLIKIVPTLLVVLLIVSVLIINNNRNKFYEEINNYVLDNEEELENIAKDVIEGKKVELPKDITEVTLHSSKEEYVKNGNTIVQFTYGENKDNKTYGFYYSVKNKPVPYQNKSYDLLEIGNDRYMWTEDKEMEGITGKIKDKWYYYKVTFKKK